jgi:hypothetical protein
LALDGCVPSDLIAIDRGDAFVSAGAAATYVCGMEAMDVLAKLAELAVVTVLQLGFLRWLGRRKSAAKPGYAPGSGQPSGPLRHPND